MGSNWSLTEWQRGGSHDEPQMLRKYDGASLRTGHQTLEDEEEEKARRQFEGTKNWVPTLFVCVCVGGVVNLLYKTWG